MFIIFPLLSFIFLFLIFNQTDCWRRSLLSASLCWGVLITAIVEILSIFKLIKLSWLVSIWIVISIILLTLLLGIKRRQILGLNSQANLEKSERHRAIPPFLLMFLFGVIFVAGTVGLIALIAPTNNWDSMAYHMPRVVHWIQNRSVAHYPTNYLAQLYQSPWSEFTIMNFQILSGGDRFANLVQWFSMVGSIIGVSLIAKELGANLLGQIFSSVVAVTIPMGILQASTTKNDYVVCFWLICLAYYMLNSLKSNISMLSCLRVSASLGLAIFTKGTGYVYALPFLLWFTTGVIKQWRWKFWKPLLLIVGVSIIINLGHYLRNLDLFGTPIFNPPEYKITSINFLLFISNIIKNMALHMAIPLDIVNNNYIELGIIKLHKFLGVDINDPRITSNGVGFGLPAIPTYENTAGNPLHFYLILTGIILFLIKGELKKYANTLKYIMAVVGVFLLFCLLIKWQPWQSRLHLSIFVLFAPFVGVVFSKISNKRVTVYMAFILLQVSLFWVFYNELRPIIGENSILYTSRIEQYFADKRYLKDDYVGAAKFVKDRGCSEIGLSMPQDTWEYPLWVLLQKDNNQIIRIEHINVNNISSVKSKQYPYKYYSPCNIISVGGSLDKEIVIKNNVFIRKWSGQNSRETVHVFVKKTSVDNKDT